MALYHLTVKIISRGNNRTAMGAAAYRSGTKLTLKFTENISDKVREKLIATSNKKYHIICKETGKVIGLCFDYSKKKGVAYSGIIAPKNAPSWVLDREQLWQRIEEYEKRVDAQLSREFEFSLQKELTPDQNLALAKDFINTSLISRGLICDYNIHYDDENKPHVHVLTLLRQLTKDLNGQMILSNKDRGWGDKTLINELRYELALITNKHFILADLPYRVSHLSYEALEIDLIPTKYEGVTRHIKGLRLAPRNDEIIRINAERIVNNPEIIINKLGIDKPVFTTDDISRELKKALEIVADDKAEQINQTALNKLITIVMASSKIEVVNFNDLKDKILFARKDRIKLEQRLMKNINSLANNKYHSLNITKDNLQIKDPQRNNILDGIKLSKEQQDAIITLCNGTGISYLKGKPGTGKTTILKHFVSLAKEHGYNVIATAPTNKGAMELEAALGVKVLNTAKLRKEWQEARGFKFVLKMALNYYQEKQYQSEIPVIDQNTIIIIDEAPMLDLMQIDYFASEAARAGAKIVTVGDDNQHKAQEAAGSATLIERIMQSRKLSVAELNEIHRHNNPDPEIRKAHRLATIKLSEFKIKEAFDIYEELGALNIYDTELQVKQAMVHEYVSEIIHNIKSRGGIVGSLIDHIAAFKSVAIGCYTNADVRYFNEKIRNHLKRCGILKGKDYAFISGSGEEQRMVKIALGEQIIFESGKKKFKEFGGVNNREIAIVTKIYDCDDKGIGSFEARIIRKSSDNQDYLETITIRTGEKIFPIKFNHGYALTSHIFQGAKVQKMLIYFEKYYESMMVLATRHVNSLKIYIAKEIMENFIYAKKDLDIAKTREDYEIQAYTDGSIQDEEGSRESYPAYKIGKYLSVSKRTDLNSSLSNNYGYILPKKEQQYLQDLKDKVKETEDKMLELGLDLKKWLSFNSKKIRKNIKKQFKLKPKEIIVIDPLKIAKSERLFKDKLILASSNPVDQATLDLKIIEHLEKIASPKKSSIRIVSKKPEWEKLAIDEQGVNDQNLIIYNSLDKKAKSKLNNLVKSFTLCKKQIKARSNSVEKYKLYLQQLAKENKQLTGNHLIVSNYSNALQELAEVLKKLELWQEKYLSPERQNIMQEKIAKNLHINMTGVKYFKVNPYMLLSAAKDFRRSYIKRHKDEINHLQDRKAELRKNPDKNQLTEYQKIKQRLDEISLNDKQDLDSAVKNYFGDLAINNKSLEKQITWNSLKILDQHFIIGNLLTSSAMKKLKILFAEKQEIQKELTKNAKIICNNYDGFARPDLTKELKEKEQQLQQEFLSVSSKWINLQKIKLNGKANRDIKTITEKDLKQVIDIYKKIRKWQQENPQQKSLSNMPVSIFGENDYIISRNQRLLLSKRNNKDPRNSKANIMNRGFCPITLNTIKSWKKFAQGNHKLQKEISVLTRQIKDASQGISDHPLKMKMRDVLNSQNLNFETVRGHANKTDYKFYFENVSVKPSLLENKKFSTEFVSLLESMLDHKNMSHDKVTQEELNETLIKVNLLKEFIKSQEKQLDIVRGEITSLKSEYEKDMEKISDIEYYQNVGFPEYLSNLFKKDSCEIIEQFNQKISGRSRDEVISYIYSKKFMPKIGELKTSILERSFLGKLLDDYKWRGDRENLRNVQENFIDYVDNKIEMAKLQDKWQQRNCEQEHQELETKLNSYKEVCPSKQEQDLLNHLEKILQPRSADNNHGNVTKYVKMLKHKDTVKILNKYKRQQKRTDITEYSQAIRELKEQKSHRASSDPWMIYHKIPGDAKELDITKALSSKFLEDHKFVTKYEYRNKYGELLGYNLLFYLKGVDYNGKPIEKLIPVSYGYNKETKSSSWVSRNFEDNENTPVYGAEKLGNNDKTVLIVQGEKTADKASELFPECAVISWLKGENKMQNINWSHLQGKNVVILPENSKNGKEVGHQMQFILTFSGVNSYVIDVESLTLAAKLKASENSKDLLLEGVKVDDIKLLIQKGERECEQNSEGKVAGNSDVTGKEATSDKVQKAIFSTESQGQRQYPQTADNIRNER